MNAIFGWAAAVCLLVAWVAAEHGKMLEARKTAVAYIQGLTEGARQQALKPCTWQQLFRQESVK